MASEDDIMSQDGSAGFDTNDAMKAFQDVIGSSPDEASQKLIGQTLTPDEKKEVGPETLAALSYFKDVLTGGTNEEITQKAGTALDEISKRKIELAKKLSEGDTLTRPQAVAAGFISMLPMLIGAAVKGRRGVAIGANAGAIGSQVLFKGIEKDNEKADTRNRLEYQELGNQQKDITKLAVDQIKSNQNFENSKQLIDYKAAADQRGDGAGSGRGKAIQDAMESGDVSGLNAADAKFVLAAREKAKEVGDWFTKAPTVVQTKLLQADSGTQELNLLGKKLKALNQNAVEFQAKEHISGTQANKLISEVKLMIPVITRLSGEVGNLAEQEQARALNATLGNWTSGSVGAAERVNEAANLYRRLALKQAEMAKKAYSDGGNGLISGLNKPLTLDEASGSPSPNPAPTPPPSGLPEIGAEFNGGKVLSIKRVD